MNFDIKTEEISKIVNIGELNSADVQLISTKGGLHLILGKSSPNSRKPEILIAGSHPGIIKYQLEKNFSGFMPKMEKSESGIPDNITQYGSHLPSDLQKSGFDVYIIKNNENVNLTLTKYSVSQLELVAKHENNILIINNISNISVDKANLLKSLKPSLTSFCKEMGIESIVIKQD